MSSNKKGFSTACVSVKPCPATGSLTPPIYQTSTFVFENAAQGKARFAGEEEGYIYSRLGNPNISALEEKIAALEGAERGLCFSSGMGAISAIIMALVKTGDHILATNGLYGCTFSLLEMLKDRYHIDYDLIDMTEADNVQKYITDRTKVVFIETPINPTMSLVDLEAVSAIAHQCGAQVVVDNTFMSPYLQRPIQWGADVVIHSATKYIGGHGDVVAGLAVGTEKFMNEVKSSMQKDIGATLGPFDAWLLLRGIKTLPIRMDRHTANATKVAQFLEQHPLVEKVFYPGLDSFPQKDLVHKQMKSAGGVLSFHVKGGYDAGVKVMNQVKLCLLAVSLGDVNSLIQHPASMTHAVIPAEKRLTMGITEGLVRLSVGIEDVEDIIEDLDQALQASAK